MPNDWCDPNSWFRDSGNLKPANSLPGNTNDIYVDNNLAIDSTTANCIDKISFLQSDNLTVNGSGSFIVGFLKAKNVTLNECNVKNYTNNGDTDNTSLSLYIIDNLSFQNNTIKNIALDVAGKISGVSGLIKNCLFLSDNIGLYLKDSSIEGFPKNYYDLPDFLSVDEDLRTKLQLSSGILENSQVRDLKIKNNSQLIITDSSNIKGCIINGDILFTNRSNHLNLSIINGDCEFWRYQRGSYVL